MKIAAAEPASLKNVSEVGLRSDLLVKLHGLFMLVAWLGCAGAGMMMARYFKQTWKVRIFVINTGSHLIFFRVNRFLEQTDGSKPTDSSWSLQ